MRRAAKMQAEQRLSFGPYQLDSAHGQLWRGKQAVKLTPKALAVLRHLVERPGQVVTKEELFGAAWPDTVVSEAALTYCIRELRHALRDDARIPRYIETVHRRGFRFIAPLSPQNSAPRTPSPPVLPLPDKPSIVVLPFVNMSHDPGQEYFSDGLTDVLTGDLSQISNLFVISRNSAFTYKGKAVKVQDVGREMGVRYVLEGSVLRAEGQVRITAQLIEATTGYHLWSERYDRPLQDILRLQDEVVRKIVTTLGLQLSVQEQGYIVRKHTDNLEAYDFFLRGVESFNRITQEANAQARQMFEKAIALDPQYAEAYAWLSHTYFEDWIFRWSTDPQTLERALALAQHALALNDSLPRAHSLLSLVYAEKHQYDQALAEGERSHSRSSSRRDFGGTDI